MCACVKNASKEYKRFFILLYNLMKKYTTVPGCIVVNYFSKHNEKRKTKYPEESLINHITFTMIEMNSLSSNLQFVCQWIEEKYQNDILKVFF